MNLRYGPYRAPVLGIGQRVRDAIRGEVVVRKFTDAPVRWPLGSPDHAKRSHGIIITGDLLRALTCEMGQAIAQGWGVSTKIVTVWRQKLGIDGRSLEGVRDFHRTHAKPPKPHSPTSEQLANAQARLRENRRARGELWTPQEEALLGTDTDRAIAAKLGRPLSSVRSRRLMRDIPPVRDSSLQRKHIDRVKAEMFGIRYPVRWDRVLEECRRTNTSTDDLARSLGTTRGTLRRRFACGYVLWRAEWIEKASRYFGLPDLLVHPFYVSPYDYRRAHTKRLREFKKTSTN
jgi:hypothetical protein